uniref:Phosphoenolpyruvate carboxylase kinase 1 n=1 Tax=Elaeis guineensis var. tenera TaxID=51953 RepID=A0A6I9QN55_ELAGV|nr:phosphoenolpyruvate carboxylase kinase 1 [Elaeis guineensis]
MSAELKRAYEIGTEIGRGRFGTVYRCVSTETGEAFAVKSIEKALLSDDVDRECIEREAKIAQLAAAGNPHAVQVHAVYEDEAWLHVVMELCPGPDLFDRISRRGSPLSEAEAAAVMAPLMEAVAVCHRRGVAHRDIKPDNVLFDERGCLKLADFGSAECFGDGRPMSGLVGTPHYVAPEVVAGRDYDEKVDVWSAGVVLYVMLSGVPPFYGDTAVEIFEAVLRANLRFPTRNFRAISPAAKDLLRRMLCKDVSRRFSADQVLGHPWITSGEGTRAAEEPT